MQREGGPCLPSRALERTPSLQPLGTNVASLPALGTVLVPLLGTPPRVIHAARALCSALVPQSWAGMLHSDLPLGGGFAAHPFSYGCRGASPSFSHCELSVGVYTTLTYLFIACGMGRQQGELADPSLHRHSCGRLFSCAPGSILCCSPFFLV